MRMMVIDSLNMFVIDEHGQIMLKSRPKLGFLYKAINYTPADRSKWVLLPTGLEKVALEQGDIDSIEAFISAQRDISGVKVNAVDGDGFYLGQIDSGDPRIAAQVPFGPPNGDDWKYDLEAKSWVQVFGFDENGVHTKRLDASCVGYTASPMPELKGLLPCRWDSELEVWSFKDVPDDEWKAVQSDQMLSGSIDSAIRAISGELRKAEIPQKRLMEAISVAIISVCKDHMADNPKLAEIIPTIEVELGSTMKAMGSEDFTKSRESYFAFKQSMATRYLGVADIRSGRLDDLIIDQYTRNQ